MASKKERKPIKLSATDRAFVIDAIKDALREIDHEDVCEYVSQRAIDKLRTALQLVEDGSLEET